MLSLALEWVLVVVHPATFLHGFHVGLHGKRGISLEAKTKGITELFVVFVSILDILAEKAESWGKKQSLGLRRFSG